MNAPGPHIRCWLCCVLLCEICTVQRGNIPPPGKPLSVKLDRCVFLQQSSQPQPTMTESVKSITQHHEPLRIFIAAESADETGKMARTFCDASDIVVTGLPHTRPMWTQPLHGNVPADVLVCDVVLNGADMAHDP